MITRIVRIEDGRADIAMNYATTQVSHFVDISECIMNYDYDIRMKNNCATEKKHDKFLNEMHIEKRAKYIKNRKHKIIVK